MFKTRKVVIVGAGHVGSHVALALIQSGEADDIVLIDILKEKAIGQALDLDDCVSGSLCGKDVSIRAGSYEELHDADIMVMAFGRSRRPGETRLDMFDDSIKMANEVVSHLKQIDKMDVPEIMQQIKSFSQRKSSMDDYLDLMLLWYRDVLMFKITKDTNILLYREEYKAISEQACIHNYQKIENIIKAIDNAKVRLAANVNFDITIELLLLTIKEN